MIHMFLLLVLWCLDGKFRLFFFNNNDITKLHTSHNSTSYFLR